MGERHRGSSSAAGRAAWLYELRRENERQEDATDTANEPYWRETDDAHRVYVDRLLSMLPPGGSVLDAACGIGRYVGAVLASGRSVMAVDASAVHLAKTQASFSDATIEKHDLQDLPYRDRFDGVMCVDAMEFVPPEDWPASWSGSETLSIGRGGCTSRSSWCRRKRSAR
ncbi:MAG: class I SAM-dependent methyltransferase [Actinobacteria bacterium]|nr:MAG: class I SAM-dependent methyltransferase [Actinomycetota bacterium]